MEKSPDAFRTISEVADHLETPAHVLRFWESRFPQIKPVKRAGGRRYYRPADIALLSGIKRLLHEEGLTIRGVQKILRDQGPRHVATLATDSHRVDALAPAAGGPGEPSPPFDARDETPLATTAQDGAVSDAPDTPVLTPTDAPADISDAAPDHRPPPPLALQSPEPPPEPPPLGLTQAAYPAPEAKPSEPAEEDTIPPLFAYAGIDPRPRRTDGADMDEDEDEVDDINLASLLRNTTPGTLTQTTPTLAALADRLAQLRAKLAQRADGGAA